MNERDKRRVGEQIEPGGRPKAPGRLELLQRFLNTWNHEFPVGWDRLGTSAKARTWLARKGLVAGGAAVTDREAARLRALRESIRDLVAADRGPTASAAAVAVIDREARGTWLRVEIDGSGHTELSARDRGVDGAVATLLGILHESRLTGSWPRLKACRQCRYVFFDRSKNRSAAWCAMSICGNRTKNRCYRARRALTTSTPRSS
jgi:predicted RNA-binding Zn ribbon-like protein